MKKWHNGLKILAIVLSLALAVPFSVISAVAASATTKIKHKSPKEYIPGFRINIDAEIKDDVGVLLARCYFKTKQDKNFAFVDMLPVADLDYRATLPAPWVNSEAIDYVFVVVNEEKKVVRSQVFIIEEKETEEAAAWKELGEVDEIRLDVVQEAVEAYEVLKKQLVTKYKDKLPKCQQEIATGELDVKTELKRSVEQLEGFYDNVVVSEAPASMKYGMLAEGLYTSEQIAAAGGQSSVASATGAASVGTVTAGTGLSTAAIVGIGVAVAAGGAAVVGGYSSSSTGNGAAPLDQEIILGYWNFAGTRADGVTRTGNMTFNANGTYAYTIVDADGQSDGSGTGTWTLSGTNLNLDFDVLPTWNGTATGSSSAFSFNNTGHGSYNFTR